MKTGYHIAALKAGSGRPFVMAKTDNEKYTKREADLFIVYDFAWEVEVEQANASKAGASYQYSETLLMLAAAVKVGLGVPYRQLESMVGKMIGESKISSFSQLCKRIARLECKHRPELDGDHI